MTQCTEGQRKCLEKEDDNVDSSVSTIINYCQTIFSDKKLTLKFKFFNFKLSNRNIVYHSCGDLSFICHVFETGRKSASPPLFHEVNICLETLLNWCESCGEFKF